MTPPTIEQRVQAQAQLVAVSSYALPLHALEADELRAVLVDNEELLKENQLLVHKVLTCGVAACHPDATLSRRGAYGDKWDSPQAEEVRKLRSQRDQWRECARELAYDLRNEARSPATLASLARFDALVKEDA